MSLAAILPGWALQRPARTLAAEQQAEIDIDVLLREASQDRTDDLNDAKALRLESAERLTESDKALDGLHKAYTITTTTIALGVFALLVMAANWFLETMLVADLGTPLPLAMLIATVSTAAYAGAGALALDKLGGEAKDKVTGAAILAALLILGVLLVPRLAQGRAQEMVGKDISNATASISTLTQYAEVTQLPEDEQKLAVAKNTLTELTQRKELSEDIFTGLLALTLATEVLLAGYGFDVLRIRRSRRLRKKSLALEKDAVSATEDANAVDTQLFTDLADVARRYAITIDRVGDITQQRLAAIQDFRVPEPAIVPARKESPLNPPAAPVLRVESPSAVHDVSTIPAGQITRTEAPTLHATDIEGPQWDGAWA